MEAKAPSTPEPVSAPLPRDVRDLVEPGETALGTLASTMRRVSESLHSEGAISAERSADVLRELDRLEGFSVEPVAVRDILVEGELSPRGFMALMANTFVRVQPTYSEIPLNLALHGAQGDLRNYGLIALNVNDEAGGGDPLRTHPALFNRSAQALSGIFGIPPISTRIGLAALLLRLKEGEWSTEEEGLALVRDTLLLDEFGQRIDGERLVTAFQVAREYSDLIAEESVQCYRWRMQTLASIVESQLLGLSHEGYLELLSLLAVREAAASDPKNIFHSLSKMIARYGGHLGSDMTAIADALWWSDVHIDEELGDDAGYDGHSVEDDHAEQALGAVLDHLYDDRDLLLSIRTMNAVSLHLRDLWNGTVRVIEEQEDAKLAINGISPEIHDCVREVRLQGQIA